MAKDGRTEKGEPRAGSAAPKDPVPATLAVVETLKAQASLREGLVNRLVAYALLVAVGAAAAFTLSPGLFAQRIPYDDGDLGGISSGTLKANQDYDIPDEETTRRMRDEAVAAVRSVYVHDASALEVTLRRIHDGFRMMRNLAGVGAEPAAPVPEDGRRRPKTDPRADEETARRLAIWEPARADLEARLEVRLDDEEFRVLAEAGFSEAVEREVVQLVGKAMREMVVADKEELAQHRTRGISIRRVGAGARPGDEVRSEVAGIRDLAKVREEIEAEAADLGDFPPAVRKVIGSVARREIRSNLQYDPDATRKRREDANDSVKPVVIQLKKGEKIIGDGERIVPRHLLIFRGMREQSRSTDLVQVRIGGALFACLVVLALFGYSRSSLTRFRPTRKDALVLAITLVGMLFFANLCTSISDAVRDRTPEIPLEAYYFAIPFAAGAMAVRFVLGAEVALVFAVAFACLVGVLTGDSLSFGVFALVGGVVAAARTGTARDRAGLFRAGAWAGLAQAVMVLCFALFGGKLASWDVVVSMIAAFLGGAVATPILVIAYSTVLENVFGYTTDIKLLELANLNHPALKELIVQAPGTYHHSIIVGSLVEQAAEAIGANPLLAKVCAYYHDLGKGRNPLSFGENQKGENRHDRLAPEESARLIIKHVEEGLEIARKYKIPRRVSDAIPQHHGTRLVGFFYHKALKAQAAAEQPQPVDPEKFRYAGPKPQSKEAALVMMADAVEAASRAMAEPSPAKLKELVQKLVNGIFADGQFDECDLTLKDLSSVAKSFCRTLDGIYHSRPDYPASAKGPQAQISARDDGAEKGEPDEAGEAKAEGGKAAEGGKRLLN